MNSQVDIKNMNTKPNSILKRTVLSPIAILVAFALAASGCGVARGEAANEFEPAILEIEDVAAAEAEGDLPEFGSSLDDFIESDPEEKYKMPEATPPPEGFEEIEWEDLLDPNFDEDAVNAKFTERIAEVEDGSPEADAIYEELQAEYDNQPVNPERAGDAIMLAGFVAPLTYDGDRVTEFLLVPYFGACIHVPPPPLNQTVIVNLQEGQSLSVDETWGAVWVVGTLTLDGVETDIGKAGYSIDDAQTGVYDAY